MYNLVLLAIFRRILCTQIQSRKSSQNTGFSMVELVVIMMIIGVLSAISAPGWIGYSNRQKATALNGALNSIIQEAQSLAKTKKLRYSVSFKTDTSTGKDIPMVAIYPTPTTTAVTSSSLPWQDLSQKVGVNTSLILGTNFTGQNQACTSSCTLNTANASNPTGTNLVPIETITFDLAGSLPIGTNPKLGSNGLIIAIGSRPSTSSTNVTMKLCVKLTTLLGAIQTGDATKSQCNP